MDNKMGRDLDNYITGHYGEDQFDNEPDPTDDGPEVQIIRDVRRATYEDRRTNPAVGPRFFFPRGD